MKGVLRNDFFCLLIHLGIVVGIGGGTAMAFAALFAEWIAFSFVAAASFIIALMCVFLWVDPEQGTSGAVSRLCFLGLHLWKTDIRVPKNTGFAFEVRKCERCSQAQIGRYEGKYDHMERPEFVWKKTTK